MNLALFINSAVIGSLQHIKRKWADNNSSAPRGPVLSRCDRVQPPSKAIAPCTLAPGVSRQVLSHGMPLRVVRVVEAGQTRASVGRMVISGRMADVCAELDRLADREAALSS